MSLAVFSWLRRLIERFASVLDSRPPKRIACQPPGEVFPWSKGVTLIALDAVVFAIPAAILEPHETIGSVIHGDDAMELNIPDGDRIYLRLQPGMSVWLTKSCQACVIAEDRTPKRVQILLEGERATE